MPGGALEFSIRIDLTFLDSLQNILILLEPAVCVFTCKFLALMQLPGEPEVGDLHIVILVQQYVLRLQIAMDNVLGVYVLDTLEYLSHDGACLLLGQRYHWRQIVEELALGAQLEYEKYKCIRLEDVLQVNYGEDGEREEGMVKHYKLLYC